MSQFDIASRSFNSEVDRVAADLVRKGVPPYLAMERAVKIVSQRRSIRNANSPSDNWTSLETR